MPFEDLLNALAVPEAWEENVWLKHSHLLVLDGEMSVKLGDITLFYREKTGLEWKKEGGPT